jgi:hypothetical protein
MMLWSRIELGWVVRWRAVVGTGMYAIVRDGAWWAQVGAWWVHGVTGTSAGR